MNSAARFGTLIVALALEVAAASAAQTTTIPGTAPNASRIEHAATESTAATAAGTSTTQPALAKLPEAFAIFENANPFLSKTHVKPTTASTGPEASTVLSGTVQSDAGWTAFMQDCQTHAVLMLSIGDPIARGKLTAIDLDSVQYEAGPTSTRVQLGQNLQGQFIAPAPPASQPTPAQSSPPNQAPQNQPQLNGQQPVVEQSPAPHEN